MSEVRSRGRGRQELARRVAQDIEDGWCVNLGIGLPEQVAAYLPAQKDVLLQSENGLLGMGKPAAPEQIDWDLINAGKKPVTLLAGGSFFDHVTSFTMMRGRHLDLCLLGAFQVSAGGDLANWWTGDPDELPAVGGAMDLVAGARRVHVIMDHTTRDGRPKIVSRCSYPLTGLGVVNRIYTNLAVIDVLDGELVVRELIEGCDMRALQEQTDALLRPAGDMRIVPVASG